MWLVLWVCDVHTAFRCCWVVVILSLIVMLPTAFYVAFPPPILRPKKNTSNGVLSFVFNLAPTCSFGSRERVYVCTGMQSLPLRSYRGSCEKKTHNLWMYVLELCFGLPLTPLPLHTAVSVGVGPLGEACQAVMLLLGGRKVPVPTSLPWVGTRLLGRNGPQKKGLGKRAMVTAARWRRRSQTHQRCSVKGGNRRTQVARREIEALFPDPG